MYEDCDEVEGLLTSAPFDFCEVPLVIKPRTAGQGKGIGMRKHVMHSAPERLEETVIQQSSSAEHA